jgi:predicted phage terminase large subunit-like protein
VTAPGLLRLDAGAIEGFSERFLIDHYDERVPTPDIHRQWWKAVTSEHPRVAIAAPRGHAKSTALNHCYGLAASLFQIHPFQLKVCKTWQLACEKLDAARTELQNNQALINSFGVRRFVRDTKDDIVVETISPETKKPYQFRMVAIGMNQAVRGSTFGTTRPTLINCDDIEDEFEVLNPDNRNTNMRWLLRTLIPMGADRVRTRVYGTFVHNDGILARLLIMKSWLAFRFEACDEQISASSILWMGRFPQQKLQEIRQGFVDADDLQGFNMEYRNLAVDYTTSFFRPEDFIPMTEEDHKKTKLYYVGGDLAFSKKEGRDYTVLTVGGLDSEGILHFVDERRGRWDGKQVIDEMYAIEEAWHPEEWFIESGAIKETLGTALEIRMRDEGYLNLCPGLIPTKDKAIRSVPLQARMRSKGCKWDDRASWFHEHKAELLEFTQEGTRGAHDDRVDADAWLAQGIKRMASPPTEQEEDAAQLAFARRQAKAKDMSEYESVTGYEFWRAQG